MLRLALDGEPYVEPDTDFEFLADSEDTPVGGLRTATNDKRPTGGA